MIIFSEKKISSALITGIIILTIFYNIGAGICIFFNINPALFNFGYKVIGSLFVIYALIGGFLLDKDRTFPKATIVVLVFWAIYTVRLLYDIEIAKVPFGFSKTEVYSFAFGGSLNLSLAIIFCGKLIDIEKLVRSFKRVLIVANLLIIFLLIYKTQEINIATLFLRRSYFSTDSEDLAMINSITIAVNGGLLLLLAIIDMWFRNFSYRKGRFVNLTNISLALLGLVNLLLGGSRGPFFFCGLIFFILFLLKLNRNGFNAVFLLKAGMVLFVLAASFIYFFGDLLTSENFALFNRLSTLNESNDPSDANRFIQIESAWAQFLASPIIGDRFVERASDFYPHSIILEALMATGIIGAVFFISFICMSIYKSFVLMKLRQNNYTLKLSGINLFFLMSCLTSGCIWNSLELWIFSLLVIVQNTKTLSSTYKRTASLAVN